MACLQCGHQLVLHELISENVELKVRWSPGVWAGAMSLRQRLACEVGVCFEAMGTLTRKQMCVQAQ